MKGGKSARMGRERGKEGVATKGRDVVSVGVLLKKGCCYKGVLLREMSLRDERRKKDVKILLKVLLYFY